MKKLLLPLLLIIVGVGGGAGAGFFLKPEPPEVAEDGTHDCPVLPEGQTVAAEPAPETEPEYVKLNNQFVVPVLKAGRVASLVILSLSVETTGDQKATVYEREPKLRDIFNEVLFSHANSGGFDGVFTDIAKMDVLRKALSEAARSVLGGSQTKILITDIVRQDT